MNQTYPPIETYYREKQVLAQFAPVHRTTWWRWIKEGLAPKPVKIGVRTVAWRKSDLERWQNQHGTSDHQ